MALDGRYRHHCDDGWIMPFAITQVNTFPLCVYQSVTEFQRASGGERQDGVALPDAVDFAPDDRVEHAGNLRIRTHYRRRDVRARPRPGKAGLLAHLRRLREMNQGGGARCHHCDDVADIGIEPVLRNLGADMPGDDVTWCFRPRALNDVVADDIEPRQLRLRQLRQEVSTTEVEEILRQVHAPVFSWLEEIDERRR